MAVILANAFGLIEGLLLLLALGWGAGAMFVRVGFIASLVGGRSFKIDEEVGGGGGEGVCLLLCWLIVSSSRTARRWEDEVAKRKAWRGLRGKLHRRSGDVGGASKLLRNSRGRR
jgi:hypothetical protein